MKKNWNNMMSHDLHAMSEEEFKEAVVQWAEGSSELEELLRLCHEKDITTHGCHIGKFDGYVEFIVEDSSRPYILRMFDVLSEIPNSQVLFSTDGGNPLSGSTWYEPSLVIDGPIPFIPAMTAAIKSETMNNSPYEKMLTIHDLLSRKRCFLDVRMRYLGLEDFHLSFEFWDDSSVRGTYLADFFANLGFVKIMNRTHCSMKFASHSTKALYGKISEVENAIQSSFAPPVYWDKNSFHEMCVKALDESGIEAANQLIQARKSRI